VPEVQIRDAKTGDCIYKIRIEEKFFIRPETRFSFSSDSQRILIGSEQPGVRDIGGCEWLTYPDIRPEQLLTSAFCSDGTWVGHAFGKEGHSIWKFFDTDSNQVMEMLREDGYEIPSSGQYAAGRRMPTPHRPSAISNDGKQIATCTEYPLRIAIVDATTGGVAFADPRTATAAGSGLPEAMAWSVNNQWLAIGAVGDNGQIEIWDPKAIKDRSEKYEVRKRIQTTALSPDGQWFASGSEDGIIKVTHTARYANSLLTLQGHDSAIQAIVFSPSARMLATQCAFNVKIWNIEAAGECVYKFTAGQIDLRLHTVYNWPMTFSPDNSQFAFRQGENVIEVHDLTEKSMYELEWEHISSLVFLPDGRSLAVGNWHGNGKVWDLQTKDAQEWKFKSHGRLIANACSSDGKMLAKAISSGNIYIWQPGAESCLLKLKTEWGVGQLSFSPETRSLITEHGRLIRNTGRP